MTPLEKAIAALAEVGIHARPGTGKGLIINFHDDPDPKLVWKAYQLSGGWSDRWGKHFADMSFDEWVAFVRTDPSPLNVESVRWLDRCIS